MIQRRLAIVLLAAMLVGSAAAEEWKWQIDNNHSAAQFAVRHLGISTVRGRFSRMSGTVQYDPADVTKTTIDATIEAGSIDTRIEMRDKDLRSPKYFDGEKFPTLTFKSKRVEAAGPGHLKVIGALTIKGVTREVALDVDAPTAPMKEPRGNERIGTAATTKLNRHDFGVGGNGPLVGGDVTITIDLELIKAASAQ